MSSLNIGELTGYIGLNTDDLQTGAQQGEQTVEAMAQAVLTAARDIERQRFQVRLDADAAELDRQLAAARAALDALRAQPASVQVQADIAAAEGNIARLESQLATVNRQRIELRIEADTSGAEEEVESLGDRIKGKAAIAAAAAGAAVGAALSTGIASAIDTETAQAKLHAQLGGSAKFAEEMGAIAGDLYANAYGENLGEVNDAVRAVIQSGALMEDATDQQISGITAKVMSLAQAFDVDVAGAAAQVGQVMRNGLAPDADTALDVITRGFQQGVDKAGDYLDSLEEYSTVFRDLGLSAADATGLMSQGLKAGARDADISADALKEFLLLAKDTGSTAAQGFEMLGLNAAEMAAKVAAGGPTAKGALTQVLDGLRAIEDPLARDAAATALFGTKAEDMQDALFALDPSKAADALGDVAGAAAEADAAMGDTAAVRVEKLRRQYEQLTASLIETDGPLGTAAAGFAAFGPDALGMAGSLAVISLAWGRAGLSAIRGGAMMAWGWISAMGPMGWVIAAVVGLVALIVANWDTVVEWTKVAWDAVSGAVSAAWDWIVGIVSAAVGWVTEIVSAGWSVLTSVVATVWNAIVAVIQPVLDVIIGIVQFALGIVLAIFFTIWNAVYAIVTGVWNAIVSFLTPIVEAIVGIVTAAWNLIYAGVSAALQAVWGVVTAIWNAIWGFLSPILGYIGSSVANTFNTVWGVVSDVLSRVWGFISSIWNTIFGFLSGVWNRIAGVVTDGVGRVWSVLTGMFNRIKGIAGEAIGWLVDAGRNIVTGLWNGIVGMGQWLYGKIMGWIKSVVPGPVLSFLGIASPSRWMRDEVGRWIPEGLADGIIANASVAGDAARQMAMDTADSARAATHAAIDPAMEAEIATWQARAAAIGMEIVKGGWLSADGGFVNAAGLKDGATLFEDGSLGLIEGGINRTAASQMGRGYAYENGLVNGGKSTTVNVYNPQAERASDSLNREARTLEALGVL